MSMLTAVPEKPRDEPFQARSMGLSLGGCNPIRSNGGYSDRPGLDAYFTFGCPRFPRLVPWLTDVY